MRQDRSVRLRLLFLHERLGALGGAESNILVVSRELQRRGHSVGLVHGPGTGRGEAQWQKVFAEHDCFPLSGDQPEIVFNNALRQFEPDLVYVHKTADLDMLQALADAPVPVVRMVHDHDLYCMRSSRYNFFTRRNCQRAASPFCVVPCGAFLARNRDGGFPVRWVSYRAKLKELELNRQFDQMIVATRFMEQELRRNAFEHIEVLPPVPIPGETSLQSSFNERNLILFAGQIIRGKGVDVLLRCLAKVRTPFECRIFGDGNHRDYCERLSGKLNLADRVHFHGHVPPEDLQPYYREASLVVVSSLWPEPFGAVGLEGLRYGLPVVAFDAGGIREWLLDGFNGFLVPWMDRQAFTQRVEELLENKALARRMGEQGRTLVAEHYHFDDYINSLEDLFTRVIARRHNTLEPMTA